MTESAHGKLAIRYAKKGRRLLASVHSRLAVAEALNNVARAYIFHVTGNPTILPDSLMFDGHGDDLTKKRRKASQRKHPTSWTDHSSE